MVESSHLIFYFDATSLKKGNLFPSKLLAGHSLAVWKPSLFKVLPLGVPVAKWPYYIFMWFVHAIDNLRGKGYKIYLVKKNGRLVHYSGVAPKCFKYRFMNDGDLIIGPVFTVPDECRKGIARCVIGRILSDNASKNACFWYVVRKNNAESRALISSFDFTCRGSSNIRKIMGMKIYDLMSDQNGVI